MTLKNNREPLLCYVKLCASFQSHQLIKAWITVRERLIWVEIGNFSSRVTLKFDRWPWKTIGHLFYVASSFVHYFIAISEFKLELQFGNTHFGSKSIILGPCDIQIWLMTLKIKANLRDLIAATGLIILLKLDSNRGFSSPCDLEIWWMTSQNYRAPLLHYIKLCASSQTPWWIQTGNAEFFSLMWPWNLVDDLDKQ